MALTKSVTLNNGVELPNAYIKIFRMEYNNHATTPSCTIIYVNIYKDKDARDQFKPEVISYQYCVRNELFEQYFDLNVLSQDGKNMISQAYEYLKTMDFYLDASNVVDTKEN